MKTANAIDTARVELLLAELRLPAVKLVWADLAAQADKEGWPAARFLAALAEHEMADRGRRRIERHLASARLLAGVRFQGIADVAGPAACPARSRMTRKAPMHSHRARPVVFALAISSALYR